MPTFPVARVLALAAVCLASGLASCSSDDEAAAPAASASSGGSGGVSAGGSGGVGGGAVGGSGGGASGSSAGGDATGGKGGGGSGAGGGAGTGGNANAGQSGTGGTGGAAGAGNGGSLGGTGGSSGTSGGSGQAGAGGSAGSSAFTGDASCITSPTSAACVACCVAHHPDGNTQTDEVTKACACGAKCAASCSASNLCVAGGGDPSDACNTCIQKGFDTGGCDVTACTSSNDCLLFQDCEALCPSDIGAGGAGGAGGSPSCGTLEVSSVAACQSCVSDNCCLATSVCAGNPMCAALDSCIVACAPTDATCRKTCQGKYPTEVKFAYSPITSCMENLCATECAVATPVCGGFTGSTPQCDACFKKSCCDEQAACAKSDSCMTFLYECFDGECNQGNDSACVANCSARYPEGAALFEAMLQCGTVQCGC